MSADELRAVVGVSPRPLTKPFRFAHNTIETVDIVGLRLRAPDGGGVAGEGEIAADAGYGQDGAAIARVAAELAATLLRDPDTDDPARLKTVLEQVCGPVSGPSRMLVEMAFLDRAARRAAVPVWRLLGLPEPGPIRLLYTVPFGAAIPDLRPLKIKLGGRDDEAVLRGLVGVPGPVILDVNRGWGVAQWAALRRLVEAVEPAVLEDPVDDPALLPEIRAALPRTAVILDEAVDTSSDVESAALLADGANVKATRLGGIMSTMDALDLLARRGATRMLGCFLEPPRTIAYMAQLAGLCEWTDLDGHFWLSADPAVMSYRLDSSRPGIPRIVY